MPKPQDETDSEFTAAKSQLTSARSQIAHVQELIQGVEHHITASELKRRRRSYRRRRPDVPTNKSNLVLSTQAGLAGRRYSNQGGHDPRSLDPKLTKLEIDGSKAERHKISMKGGGLVDQAEGGIDLMDERYNRRNFGKKRSESDIRLSNSMSPSSPRGSSGSIHEAYSLRRSKSDETSNASPMPAELARTKKGPTGVLKWSKSLPQQHDTLTKRVSFCRAPIDPEEVVCKIPQQKTDPDGVMDPKPNGPVLSLFETEEIQTKDMSNTVMATVEPPNDTDSTNSKINNRQKTFKKSLDRPVSRRNSTTSVPKSTPPSYSRRHGDMSCDQIKKHNESSPTSPMPSVHGKIDQMKQNFMKYVAQSNNGRNRFD